MDAPELILQASRLINGQGDPCEAGCAEEEVQDMILYCKHIHADKPFCVVSGWCWGDIDVCPRWIEKLAKMGVQPAFVYANRIVDDEANRCNANLSVKTGFLVKVRRNCIFETRNTFYVLGGAGSRMTVSPQVYVNLIF